MIIEGNMLQLYLFINTVLTIFNFIMIWKFIRFLDTKLKKLIKEMIINYGEESK